MKPLATARGDNRRQEKTLSRKQGAREPRPAVSIPLVKSSSGLRRARRRRRGGFAGGRFAHHLLGADLSCRGLPYHLFRRRLLDGSFLGRGLLHRPFLGHCLARGFFDSALFYRGLLRDTLLRRGFPCWLFGGCLHHVQSSSAVFSRLIRNAD